MDGGWGYLHGKTSKFNFEVIHVTSLFHSYGKLTHKVRGEATAAEIVAWMILLGMLPWSLVEAQVSVAELPLPNRGFVGGV
jgi:hypothetical protein